MAVLGADGCIDLGKDAKIVYINVNACQEVGGGFGRDVVVEAIRILIKGLCRTVGGGAIGGFMPGVGHVVKVVRRCIRGYGPGIVSNIGDGFSCCEKELR